MKPKLVLITGVTAVGKSIIASNLARRLKTEIIVGDSLQLYKNFPVSSNFPSSKQLKQVPYNLLGSVNVFDTRLTSVEYKQMVVQEINRLTSENKTPLIEGGGGFYLNYLLTSDNNMYNDDEWNQATKEAARMRTELDSEGLVKELRKLCPQYDNSIPVNDIYRLEKALKYALASKGKEFTWRNSPEERLTEIFDVRGFFLTMKQEELKAKIDARCYEMCLNGMFEEFLEYITTKQGNLAHYSGEPIPIGYEETAVLFNKFIQLQKNSYTDTGENLKATLNMVRDFMADFQTSSRRYASAQRKYFRSKFKYFLWKQLVNPQADLRGLSDQIYEEIMCSPEEFQAKVNSNENEKNIMLRTEEKKTKLFKPAFDLRSDNMIVKKLMNLAPKLMAMEKINTLGFNRNPESESPAEN